MNYQIFTMINNLAGHNHLLDQIMIFATSTLPILFVLILGLYYFLGWKLKRPQLRQEIFTTTCYILIYVFISYILGKIVPENRPFVDHAVNLLIPHPATESFPSTHVIITFGIAMCMYKFKHNLGIILIFLSLIVGFSRIYVGHHYPVDVLGAMVIVLILDTLLNKYVGNLLMLIYNTLENKTLKALFSHSH